MLTTTRLTRTAALLAVGAAFAIPAAASARDRKADNAIVGGLLGALAGGLIGGDATGALVGAGAGALIGAAATHGGQDYGRYGHQTRYEAPRGYGYGQAYGQPTYGYGRETAYGGYGQSYSGYAQGYSGYGQSSGGYNRGYPVNYGYGGR